MLATSLLHLTQYFKRKKEAGVTVKVTNYNNILQNTGTWLKCGKDWKMDSQTDWGKLAWKSGSLCMAADISLKG